MKTKLIKIFFLFFLILIVSIFLIVLLNNKVLPIYMDYAESELERVVTTVINKVVSECELSDNLFFVKTESNNITIVDYDPKVMNNIISEISNAVYDDLKLIGEKREETLEKYNLDAAVFSIPSGIVFHSILLNNLGPKIPLGMELVSSVNSNLETKVTEYGINNSLIEVNIRITASIRMILPTSSKKSKITVVVPLTVKIIQGNIPEYYFGSLKKETTK